MTTRTKMILVAIPLAIAAFLLSPVIWPRSAEGMLPAQLALLMVVGACEAIAFGIGVAFLIFGWPWVKCVAQGSKGVAWALYLSIAWSLVSWWPHDNMHTVLPHDDIWGLIKIEYIFHVTLVIAAICLAWGFFHLMPKCAREVK